MTTFRPWTLLNGKWGHPLHSMSSYLGTFPPSLVRTMIELFTDEKDYVFDPFCGRGTTLLESRFANRIGIASDLNPLAYRLTMSKNVNISKENVLDRILDLKKDFSLNMYLPEANVQSEEIKLIYHPYTLAQLCYLREELLDSELNEDIFLLGVLLGIMHGGERKDGSSIYASISMPNTFSMSPNYVRKYVGRNKLKRVERNVFDLLENRVNRLLNDDLNYKQGHVFQLDAKQLKNTNQLSKFNKKIKLVVTSPPYLNIINYALQNWIRLWLLNENPKEIHQKLDDDLIIGEAISFLKLIINNLKEIIMEDGIIVFIIGDVVKSENSIISLAKDLIKHLHSEQMFNDIGLWNDSINESNKVTKIWSENKGKATNIDRILILSNKVPKFNLNNVVQAFNLPGEISENELDAIELQKNALSFAGIHN